MIPLLPKYTKCDTYWGEETIQHFCQDKNPDKNCPLFFILWIQSLRVKGASQGLSVGFDYTQVCIRIIGLGHQVLWSNRSFGPRRLSCLDVPNQSLQ